MHPQHAAGRETRARCTGSVRVPSRKPTLTGSPRSCAQTAGMRRDRLRHVFDADPGAHAARRRRTALPARIATSAHSVSASAATSTRSSSDHRRRRAAPASPIVRQIVVAAIMRPPQHQRGVGAAESEGIAQRPAQRAPQPRARRAPGSAPAAPGRRRRPTGAAAAAPSRIIVLHRQPAQRRLDRRRRAQRVAGERLGRTDRHVGAEQRRATARDSIASFCTRGGAVQVDVVDVAPPRCRRAPAPASIASRAPPPAGSGADMWWPSDDSPQPRRRHRGRFARHQEQRRAFADVDAVAVRAERIAAARADRFERAKAGHREGAQRIDAAA